MTGRLGIVQDQPFYNRIHGKLITGCWSTLMQLEIQIIS